MPVLDVAAISGEQLTQLAGVYDVVATKELGAIVNLATDEVRSDIDHAFSQVLSLPSLNDLRAELASEPIIKLRPCLEEDVPLVPEAQLEFELI
jgi:hypothetical protein